MDRRRVHFCHGPPPESAWNDAPAKTIANPNADLGRLLDGVQAAQQQEQEKAERTKRKCKCKCKRFL